MLMHEQNEVLLFKLNNVWEFQSTMETDEPNYCCLVWSDSELVREFQSSMQMNESSCFCVTWTMFGNFNQTCNKWIKLFLCNMNKVWEFQSNMQMDESSYLCVAWAMSSKMLINFRSLVSSTTISNGCWLWFSVS